MPLPVAFLGRIRVEEAPRGMAGTALVNYLCKHFLSDVYRMGSVACRHMKITCIFQTIDNKVILY